MRRRRRRTSVRGPGPGFACPQDWGRRRGFVQKGFRNFERPPAGQRFFRSALHSTVDRFDKESWRDRGGFAWWVRFRRMFLYTTAIIGAVAVAVVAAAVVVVSTWAGIVVVVSVGGIVSGQIPLLFHGCFFFQVSMVRHVAIIVFEIPKNIRKLDIRKTNTGKEKCSRIPGSWNLRIGIKHGRVRCQCAHSLQMEMQTLHAPANPLRFFPIPRILRWDGNPNRRILTRTRRISGRESQRASSVIESKEHERPAPLIQLPARWIIKPAGIDYQSCDEWEPWIFMTGNCPQFIMQWKVIKLAMGVQIIPPPQN